MKKLTVLFLIILCFARLTLAQTLIRGLPRVVGTINTMSKSGDTLYVGGEFTKVFEKDALCDRLARFNARTGVFSGGSLSPGNPTSIINKAIPDGQGGFYISRVGPIRIGDSLRQSVAHIDSSGKITNKARGFFLTNGGVSTMALQNDTLFIGGGFNWVHDSAFSISNSAGAILSVTEDATLNMHSPKVNGTIQTVISDGSGGWYIGGLFTMVGDSMRSSAARIDSTGKVLSWNPKLTAFATVFSILLSDSGTVYLGGNFSTSNGLPHQGIAEVDTSVGNPTIWNPVIIGSVASIAVKDSLIYVFGPFTSIGGQAREKLAAINRFTGHPTLFNPIVTTNGSRYASLAIKDSLLFIGGTITAVGGQARKAASVNIYTGAVTTWNPVINGEVYAFAVNNNKLFMGGLINSVNGVPRKAGACFNLPNYTLSPWSLSNIGGISIRSFTFLEDKVFISGLFSNVSGTVREGIALLDTVTGVNCAAWNVYANGIIYSTAVSNNNIYIGGGPTLIGGKVRMRTAAINVNTGRLTDWDPGVSVTTIIPADSIIYLGGNFTSVIGNSRTNLAAVSPKSGVATSWNPTINMSVQDMILKDSFLYVAGVPNSPANEALSLIHTSTGVKESLTAIVPAGKSISSIAILDTLIFIAGDFNSINGQPRDNLASIGLGSEQLTQWNPIANERISEIVLQDSILYVIGSFSNIGGALRIGIASLFANTGMVTSWAPHPQTGSHIYQSICFSDGQGCVTGSFMGLGGNARSNLAAFNLRDNSILPWAPTTTAPVNNMKLYDSKVIFSGSFTNVNGVARNYLAIVDRKNGELDSVNINPNAEPSSILIKDSIIYACGAFTSLKGIPRNKLGSANLKTGNITSWNPSVSPTGATGLTMFISDSIAYIGGDFTFLDTIPRSRIAAFKLSDGTLASWNPVANGSVKAIDSSGGLLFVAGAFTEIGGKPRIGLAAIDPVSGAVKGWDAKLNQGVSLMNIVGNKMYISGTFTRIGATMRGYNACLRLDSALASGWSLGNVFNVTAYPPRSIVVSEGRVYAGNGMNITIQGENLMGLAAVTEDTTNVPLPVKLLSFTVKKRSDNDVELKWITASEKNSSHFIVERSIDAETFKNIVHIKAAGNSHSKTSYSTNDQRSNNEPVIYYRLRQVDRDGTETLSPMISVSFKEKEEISMYPNPSSGWVYFSHTSSHISECSVFDLNGREMKQFILQQNGLTMIDCSHLEAGLYFVKVSNEAETKTMRLFISK